MIHPTRRGAFGILFWTLLLAASIAMHAMSCQYTEIYEPPTAGEVE